MNESLAAGDELLAASEFDPVVGMIYLPASDFGGDREDELPAASEFDPAMGMNYSPRPNLIRTMGMNYSPRPNLIRTMGMNYSPRPNLIRNGDRFTERWSSRSSGPGRGACRSSCPRRRTRH
jgi:hypothetical protein